MQGITFYVSESSRFMQAAVHSTGIWMGHIVSKCTSLLSELIAKVARLLEGIADRTDRTFRTPINQIIDSATEGAFPPPLLQLMFEYISSDDIMEWAAKRPPLLMQRAIVDRIFVDLQNDESQISAPALTALLFSCNKGEIAAAIISRLKRPVPFLRFPLSDLCTLYRDRRRLPDELHTSIENRILALLQDNQSPVFSRAILPLLSPYTNRAFVRNIILRIENLSDLCTLYRNSPNLPYDLYTCIKQKFADYDITSLRTQRADELTLTLQKLIPVSDADWKAVTGQNRIEVLRAIEAEFLANDHEKLKMCTIRELGDLLATQSQNPHRGHSLCQALYNRLSESAALRFCNHQTLILLFSLPFPLENRPAGSQSLIITELLRNGHEKLRAASGENIFMVIQKAQTQWLWDQREPFWRATQGVLVQNNAAKLRECTESQRQLLANAFNTSLLFRSVLREVSQ
ncbi:MAG: hypothetical protein JWO53_40 [Chlamydiia bacterium]|nr:hypothetical protein [Chlamydiia bacterium]